MNDDHNEHIMYEYVDDDDQMRKLKEEELLELEDNVILKLYLEDLRMDLEKELKLPLEREETPRLRNK